VDTAFVELMGWARLTVERCVALKAGEQVLILTDTRAHEYRGASAIIQALMGAVRANGGEPNLLIFTPRDSQVHEPPRPVASAMRAADVIFSVPSVPLTETEAMRDALAAGARVLLFGGASAAGRDDDMLYRLAPRSLRELEEAGALATAIADAFNVGREVHLTTRLGTDLKLRVGDLGIIAMDGRCDRPGTMQFFVPGLVNAGVTPGSASGRVVVDASLAPLPGSLPSPVSFNVRDGFVVDIEGGPLADAWRRFLEGLDDPNAYNVSEFGLGANRRARLAGKVVEEEAAYGVGHVGFGTDIAFGGQVRAAWHGDGCMTAATVDVGGRRICEDGQLLLESAAPAVEG
jgi:leucyl aminopeptidase (aminopeptidase T)